MTKLHFRLLISFLVVLSLVAAYFWLPPETVAKIRTAFWQFRVEILVLTALVSSAQILCMCARFWILLPSPRPSFFPVATAITNGHLVNAFAPARAGEAVKILQLSQGKLKIPLAETTATFAIDKLVDFLAILFLVAIIRPPALSTARSADASPVWIWVLAGACVLLGLGWLFRGYLIRWKPHWDNFLRNLRALKDIRKIAPSFLFAVGAWGFELVALKILCDAQGVPMSWEILMAVLVALNLSISIGASVANLGTFEAPIVYVLTKFGTSTETALAIAVTHHALQWAAVGLVLLGVSLGSRKTSSSSRIS